MTRALALLLGLTFCLLQPLAMAERTTWHLSNWFRQNDTLYWADGEVNNDCQVLQLVDDYIRVECSGFRNIKTFTRLHLAPGDDTVVLRNGETYTGNIFYFDERKVELRSPARGYQALSRWMIDHLILGQPVIPDEAANPAVSNEGNQGGVL